MSETAVRERPILFSGPMVRAILDGKKTQTRRVVKDQPNFDWSPTVGFYSPTVTDKNGNEKPGAEVYGASDESFGRKCPYGKPGDRLWVKTGYTTRYDAERNETHWKTEGGWITTHGQAMSKTGKPKRDGGHPGRFMPKWLSQEFRLPALEITDIRVQRLQEISEEDARAEGFQPGDGSPVNGFDTESPYPARAAFAGLWEELNADRGYGCDVNPWIWAISFRRVGGQA